MSLIAGASTTRMGSHSPNRLVIAKKTPSHASALSAKCRVSSFDYGGISYDVVDERPESYRLVCTVPDGGAAKHDAEQIALALNLLVQFGKETLPKMND